MDGKVHGLGHAWSVAMAYDCTWALARISPAGSPFLKVDPQLMVLPTCAPNQLSVPLTLVHPRLHPRFIDVIT